MQLFRFTAAILLIVVASLAGIAQEKRHLELTRAISLQQYRTDQLLERRARLRLRIHELTSPARRTLLNNVLPQPSRTSVDSTAPVR